MSTNQKLTDLSYLEKFTNGDKEKIKKYISMYLKNTPDVIRNFQKELDDHNLENLRLKAHSIKPQATYFGIEKLQEVLFKIESIILNSSNLDELQTLILSANQLNEEITDELTSILND
jgi:HPt (histidine-containing phosphotransfer) domain-containing protein